jgi:hypothetical protein
MIAQFFDDIVETDEIWDLSEESAESFDWLEV